jgi:hypothetical protein
MSAMIFLRRLWKDTEAHTPLALVATLWLR